MTALVHVPFHGDELLATQDDDGIWVSVRRVCEVLGIDFSSQRAKLNSKAWARVVLITTPSPGGPQKTYCLHLDALPMWLATIETSRVAPEVRPKLERYQLEVARVLAEHFVHRGVNRARQAFFDRVLLKEPMKRDGQWPSSTWKAIQGVYRYPIGERPWPAFRMVVGMLHRRYLGDEGRDEVRRRNPNPERARDYNYFADDLHFELKDSECKVIEGFARAATGQHVTRDGDVALFWRLVDTHTGYKPAPEELAPADPRQLLLFDRLAVSEDDDELGGEAA